MDRDRVLAHQTLIIEDGVITTVGPSREVAVGEASVVDCSGKYLLPGLADMHVHLWEPTDIALYLASGVTAIRNMWGAPLHLAMQRDVARSAIPGPRIYTASPIIDGLDSRGRTRWPGAFPLTEPERAAPLARHFARRGYQQLKAYQQLSLDVLAALGTVSAEVGLRVTGHCPNGVSYEQAIAAGMSCFEHLTNIATGRASVTAATSCRHPSLPGRKAVDVLNHSLDFDSLRRLAEVMASRGIWNCPTITVNTAAAREFYSSSEPELTYQADQTMMRWLTVRRRHAASLGEDCRGYAELMQRKAATLTKVVSILYEAGAPLLVGTDARNPFVFQGASVHTELGHFVQAGLTPYQALRCATVEAARFLGESDSWGTIAAGRRADLVLLASNPLHDMEVLRHPEAVLINGFCLRQPELQSLLLQRQAWARATGTVPDRWGQFAVGRQAGSQPSPFMHPPIASRPLPAAGQSSFGALVERRYRAPVAKVLFHHCPLADGGWVIEEEVYTALDGTVCKTSFQLTPELVIRSGQYKTVSPTGLESCKVAMRPDGCYEVGLLGADGVATTTVLCVEALVPSERLAISFWPMALRSRRITDGSVLNALSVDNGEPHVIPVSVRRQPHGAEDHVRLWCLTISRLGEPADLIVRLGRRSRKIEISDDLPSMGEWRTDHTVVDGPAYRSAPSGGEIL